MKPREKSQQSDPTDQIRLNVFLQECGVASRRKADELIASGMVKVNGKVVSQLGVRISRSDKVHVQGRLVGSKSIPKVVYILNKPDMCLTTRFDSKMRRTIFDLAALKSLPSNVQAVGRLDYRSEGLLLLTNDGDLAYALTHPRFSVEKTYAVLVSDGVTIEDVEKLRAGVMLDDGLAKAVSVRLGSKEKMGATRGQWLELVVTEGRNRLIRRMAEAIGLKVVRLVRVGMGEILLPATLKSGAVAAVDASGQKQLEQIKQDMLKSMTRERHKKASFLDPETSSKRKMKRKLKLNDDEYAQETVRRSAEASARRKQRIVSTQGSRAALSEGPTSQTLDLPQPRIRSGEKNSGPEPIRKSGNGPVPKAGRESGNRGTTGAGASSGSKRREPARSTHTATRKKTDQSSQRKMTQTSKNDRRAKPEQKRKNPSARTASKNERGSRKRS
jgi:23S rRNA pseudouridine2605 synthase